MRQAPSLLKVGDTQHRVSIEKGHRLEAEPAVGDRRDGPSPPERHDMSLVVHLDVVDVQPHDDYSAYQQEFLSKSIDT